MRGILEKIAEKYEENENLIFASINVSFNKIEELSQSYPTILFFASEDKLNPIIFFGELIEEKIDEFIKKQLKSKVDHHTPVKIEL